jgi:integrase
MAFIKQSFTSPQEELPTLNNTIGSSCLVVTETKTGKEYSIDFDWPCSKEKTSLIQAVFFHHSSIALSDQSRKLSIYSISSYRSHLTYIKRFALAWEEYFSDRKLHSLSLSEIYKLITVTCTLAHTDGSSKIMGRSAFGVVIAYLNDSYKLYHTGAIWDGISFHLTKKNKVEIVNPLLEGTHYIDYEDWYESESYGSIPLPCAMATLSEAIDLVTSDEAKIAACFYETVRRFRAPHLTAWFPNHGLDRLDLYHTIINKSHEKDSRIPRTVRSALYFGTKVFKEIGYVPKTMPWGTWTDLQKFTTNIKRAVISILLILSGFRRNEVGGLNASDYEQDKSGTWWFKTSNPKTEENSVHPRPLHGLTSTAANMVKRMSFLSPSTDETPLFFQSHTIEAFTLAKKKNAKKIARYIANSRYSLGLISTYFNQFYISVVAPKHPDILKLHPRISPHQARHSWAEFALRRFDGNVEPRIREHFRHNSGSYHIYHYTRNKLHESVKKYYELEHAREVFGRIGQNSSNDKFSGPAATRILREMGQTEILTPEEFESKLDELTDQILRFVAFEWGYCVPRKGEERLAKCIDRETLLPNIETHGCPEVCCYCPHNMANTEQAATMERIGISHQWVATHHPLKTIGKMSADIAAQIAQRLKRDAS